MLFLKIHSEIYLHFSNREVRILMVKYGIWKSFNVLSQIKGNKLSLVLIQLLREFHPSHAPITYIWIIHLHAWNYSVENTTRWFLRLMYIHEIYGCPGWNRISLKRHLHQEPATGPGLGKGSLLLLSSETEVTWASAQAHTERSVTPTGEVWTDTQGEGATQTEAETGLLLQSHPSNSKDRGQPPRREDRLQDRFSLKPSGRAVTSGYHCSLHNRAKCISVVFSYTVCGTLLQQC